MRLSLNPSQRRQAAGLSGDVIDVANWAARDMGLGDGQIIHLQDTDTFYQLLNDGSVSEYMPVDAYKWLDGGDWETYIKGDKDPDDGGWPSEWVEDAGNTVDPTSDGTWLLFDGRQNSLDSDVCYIYWTHGYTSSSFYVQCYLKSSMPASGENSGAAAIRGSGGETQEFGLALKPNDDLFLAGSSSGFVQGFEPIEDISTEHLIELLLSYKGSAGYSKVFLWSDHKLVSVYAWNRQGTAGTKRFWIGDGTSSAQGKFWIRELRIARAA